MHRFRMTRAPDSLLEKKMYIFRLTVVCTQPVIFFSVFVFWNPVDVPGCLITLEFHQSVGRAFVFNCRFDGRSEAAYQSW